MSQMSSPTTSTSSSPGPSSRSSTPTPSTPESIRGNWAQRYDVPWEKLSRNLIKSLKEGKRPLPSLRREMIRTVVDDLMQICKRPLKKHLETIACKIVTKYSASFQDVIEGHIVGTGYDSMHRQLISRVENCARKLDCIPRKRLRVDSTTSSASEERAAAQKHHRDSYGCVNYNPTQLPADETEESLLEKKEAMKQAFQRGEDIEVADLMRKTFILQRRDVLTDTSVQDLVTEWPYLFTKTGTKVNFQELVGIDIESALTATAKFSRVKSFMKDQVHKELQRILFRVESAEEELGNASPSTPGIILMIMKYFNEKPDSLIVEKDVSLCISMLLFVAL
ncbi:Uncharacterised protein at_DN1090 [Pycnogonum litorale]